LFGKWDRTVDRECTGQTLYVKVSPSETQLRVVVFRNWTDLMYLTT